MRNLVTYVGIGLLTFGLVACDNNKTSSTAQNSETQSTEAGKTIALLDGKLSFSLPADMTDQSGKVSTQSNNMHVYSDPTGQKAMIIIVGDSTSDSLSVLAKRLEEQQRSRDPQLQVVANKAVTVKDHTLQQLDSIISTRGMTAWSSVILSNIDGKLMTMQITLPADNQQKAQADAESIINTIIIK